MKLRFPLFAKLLLLFFLNLILLGGAFFLLLRAEVKSGFDWLLTTGAGPRIQAVSNTLVDELNERPLSEWNVVLKRFNQIYHLQFFLFRNVDGLQMAGDIVRLPAAVKSHLGVSLNDISHPLSQASGINEHLTEFNPDISAPSPAAQPVESIKFVVRTLDPTRYWMLVSVEVEDPGMSQPIPATLVVLSPNMSAGGLLFNFKPWLILGISAVLFSAMLWFPMVHSLTRSIGEMTEATRRVAEGHFDGRVSEKRHDELGQLGRSINRMAARLAGFVSGQRRFLGDISHELCAPIARTQMALGILEQRDNERNKEQIQDLREEVQSMSNLVNELLSFSKASLDPSAIKLRAVSVKAVVEEAVRHESKGITSIQQDIPGDLVVLAEPAMLQRAVANLLRNAIRYAGQAGPVAVSAQREDGVVHLTIADSGPGVPESELARIFDPFYRPDISRDANTGGVGLGLAIVKTCVESCHGSVSCRNRKPSGLEVTVNLSALTEKPPE
jgi:two-component system sensor histidine kinase CpxA